MEDEILSALCCLQQLRSLCAPWRLTLEQLQTLCNALPSLECLGLGEVEDAFLSITFPRKQTLTVMPSMDEAAEPIVRWTPQRTYYLLPDEVPAFTALRCLLGCGLYPDQGRERQEMYPA